MDTPNINGAKTTTMPATLAGGWYTQLTERTKRSRHSWSMIPFTEPSYSVPDGNSRKVGEAMIPTVFSLQTNPNQESNSAEPDSLKRCLADLATSLTENATREGGARVRAEQDTRRRFARRASVLSEEMVRYLATGTSLMDYDDDMLIDAIAQLVDQDLHNAQGDLDTHSWIDNVMTQFNEVRFNEWGAGGPVSWLYALQQDGMNLVNSFNVGLQDLDISFTGKRLKSPVLVHYMNDPRVFNTALSQQVERADGAPPLQMDIAAMTGSGLQIVYASNIDDASAMIASDPFGNTIAVYSHNRDTHVLVHPSLYNQYGYRLRRLLQDLGPLRPSTSHIGLGHMHQNNSIVRPTLGWSVGQLQYNGANYRADGSCYIPSDYHPYSLLKRTAKFNHVVTQVGSAWLGSFGSYGCGDQEGIMHRRGTNGAIAPMVQMLWGEQFGYTASPSIPTEPYFEPEVIAQRMDEHIISSFGSGILAFDAGAGLDNSLQFLNALVAGLDGGADYAGMTAFWMGAITGIEDAGTISNNFGDGGVISIDEASLGIDAVAELANFGISRAIEHVWAAVKAGIGPLFQVPMTPMTMLHSGGPRPGHVVERLQMNFRPDMSVSGGTAGTKPYFLMPTHLNPGEVVTRIPCFLDITSQAAAIRPNTWLGPRDPTVLTGIETIHYDGDRPREMTDPDYALESPIIIRDATVGTVERNGRPVTIHRLPRPAYHRPGATFVGVFNTLTHGIESANGNYYLYPTTFEDGEDTLHYEPGMGDIQMTGVQYTGVAAPYQGSDAGGAVETANVFRETTGYNGQTIAAGVINPPLVGLQPEANGQTIGIDMQNLSEIGLRPQGIFPNNQVQDIDYNLSLAENNIQLAEANLLRNERLLAILDEEAEEEQANAIARLVAASQLAVADNILEDDAQ